MTAPAAPPRRSALRAVRAFGRNDLAGVRRDSMLLFLMVAPFTYVAIPRYALPPLTGLLRDRYAFDLAPYHDLVVSMFIIAGEPMLLGALAGLLLLDEKDTGTLHALRVTPVPMVTFAAYRVATVVGVSFAYVVIGMALSGLMPAHAVPGMLGASLCAGLVAALVAVVMALVAGNKVEGLAVVRAIGLVIAGVPILPYFLPAPWDLLFGVLPSYWPVKVYWLSAEGAAFWPYLLAGLACNAALLLFLLRLYGRRRFG
ncbi:hypothetical protein ACFOVU_23485 [Nocardiopsis sediminis]|uniref:ABC transporter permease n=1 Tax=Nocardiopsis sediminis TaxID=1778267 RepID=A0ABV8FRW3_9ACTN